MSYGVSAALQAAIYTALQADAALNALVGDHIYDALPKGTVPPTYVALGPETVSEASAKTCVAASFDFVISVVTEESGFFAAKEAAGAISDVLDGADLTLSRGRLVGLWFRRARARHENEGLRRIDLTFRAYVEDDAA